MGPRNSYLPLVKTMHQNPKKFVFVYNSSPGSLDRSGRHLRSSARTAFPSLAALLGAPDSTDLSAIRISGEDNDGESLFAGTGEPDVRLTTATVATILHQASIPTISLSDISLLAGAGELSDVHPREVLAIGISTTFVFDQRTLDRLIDEISTRLPGTPVILGGAGVTLNPEWFAKSQADYLICGDAEVALPSLIGALRNQGSVDSIANLRWKDPAGQIQSCPGDDSLELDSLPTTRWDLVNEGQWPQMVWYESLRGCPFRCKFCSYPQQSPVWRTKSAKRLAEDFLYYASKGVEEVACLDSTMITPPTRMREFTQRLIDAGSPIFWHCFGHPAQLQSSELCEKMFAAGCRMISIGVESGSETILANMDKKISRPRAARALRNVKASGILSLANFMVGFPGETEETAQETTDFIKEVQPDYYSIQPFQVRDHQLPILDEADQYGLEVSFAESRNQSNWKHDTMDQRTAMRLCQEIVAHLVSTPDCPSLCMGTLAFTKVRCSHNWETPLGLEYRRQYIFPILREYEKHYLNLHFGKPAIRADKTIPRRFDAEFASGRLQWSEYDRAQAPRSLDL